MNLSQTHADVEINKAEVMNMIQNRMSCDSVVMYYDLSTIPYNYDVKEECKYLETLKNNGFKITTSLLQVDPSGKSKWYYEFRNGVMVKDLKTKAYYSFCFIYVPKTNKWCLFSIAKQRQ